jgi:hypothetical protein
MSWQPLPIIGEAYADDALPWSSQDVLNWLPVPAERPGTRSQWKLASPPGLVEYANLGTNAPVRGTHDVEGLLLAVSGDKLFSVAPNGTATQLGLVPGTGRVSMAHNQVSNGYEVLIANGQSGYVYDTRTGVYGQITDPGFPGLKNAQFIDGYIGGVEPQGRFWAHSELRQAREWNTLDRYDAEAQPDQLVTSIVSNREVFVLGGRTGQFFRNTGATTGTFQNSNGTETDVGCAGTFAAARMDNTVYWLGNDGLAYRLAGSSPQIISTGPIAQAMSARNLAAAFCTVWEEGKHKVVYFTFPDGETFGYDAWTDKWHRRGSYGLNRWRLNTLTNSRGRWIGGDFANGRLYRLDSATMTEDGNPLVSRLRSPVVHAEGNHIHVAGLKLVFDVGRAPTGQSDHFTSIRYSDDGGHNWSNARIASLGARGQYGTRVEERRMGRTQTRTWEIEVSSPGKRDLLAASWMAEVQQ